MRSIGRVQAGGAALRAGGAGRVAGGFSLGGGRAAPPAELTGASAVAALGLGLLAAQEEAEAPARDAAARQRAESLLDELQGLQRDLLRGGGDPARLARLAALETGEQGADPVLRELVQGIVLRAQVELARRGWGGAGSGD
jgi:hypothetical protein